MKLTQNGGNEGDMNYHEIAQCQGSHIELLHLLSLAEVQVREARMNVIVAMENSKAAEQMGSIEVADPSIAGRLAARTGLSVGPIDLGGPTLKQKVIADCKNRAMIADQQIAQAWQAVRRVADLRGIKFET